MMPIIIVLVVILDMLLTDALLKMTSVEHKLALCNELLLLIYCIEK